MTVPRDENTSPSERLLRDPTNSSILPLNPNSSSELYREKSEGETKNGAKREDVINPKEKRLASAGRQGPTARRTATGYMPVCDQSLVDMNRDPTNRTKQIEDYGLIGNLRTCAMIASDGGLDYMCWYVNINKFEGS